MRMRMHGQCHVYYIHHVELQYVWTPYNISSLTPLGVWLSLGRLHFDITLIF